MTNSQAQLNGGRFLAELYQKDSVQGAFMQKIITAINKLGATLGANPVGEAQAPPPINNINVKTSGELLHVTLNHNHIVSKGINYFVEVDTDPNFTQPLVHHQGASRAGVPFSLPTKDDAGNTYKYYVRAYAQYPGSRPSKATVFGGPLNPASITLGGTTQMTLLPSTGSGTASPVGQQGGSGFGKVQTSQAIQGPAQASVNTTTPQQNI